MTKDHHSDDIALRKVQRELKSSQQILNAIFGSTQSSIFLIDSDYRILFFNKWASDGCKYLYGKDMHIGDSILDFRDENDPQTSKDFKEDFQLAIHSKQLVVREREMHHAHLNLHYWVRLEHTPVLDGQNLVGVLLNVLNISDKKEIEHRNNHQHKQLTQIAWSQSHETRQPLATLLGLINILDKKTLTKENLEIIQLLEDTALKLDRVIQQTVIIANNAKPR